MFLSLIFLGLFIMFFLLWGDYIKVLIFIEISGLVFVMIVIFLCKIDYFRINYFFFVLVFLVCESRLGFLLFIYYIRIEYEVVKKINLIQF